MCIGASIQIQNGIFILNGAVWQKRSMLYITSCIDSLIAVEFALVRFDRNGWSWSPLSLVVQNLKTASLLDAILLVMDGRHRRRRRSVAHRIGLLLVRRLGHLLLQRHLLQVVAVLRMQIVVLFANGATRPVVLDRLRRRRFERVVRSVVSAVVVLLLLPNVVVVGLILTGRVVVVVYAHDGHVYRCRRVVRSFRFRAAGHSQEDEAANEDVFEEGQAAEDGHRHLQGQPVGTWIFEVQMKRVNKVCYKFQTESSFIKYHILVGKE